MEVKRILQLQEKMESDRSTFESHWSEVAKYVHPNANYFNSSAKTQGGKKNTEIFDSTAVVANNRFAASMSSLMTPANQIWHRLTSMLGKEETNQEIKEFYTQVNKLLFKFRYRAKAGFDAAMNETYLNEGAFGNGAIFVGYDPGQGPVYVASGLESMYWMLDQFRRISIVHRKYKATSQQLLADFGIEALPKAVLKDLKKDGTTEHEIIHSVIPSGTFGDRLDQKDFSSKYIMISEAHVLSEGGFDSMPYSIGRYVVSSQEVYGRSVAMDALPDIKTLNTMSKTLLKAGQQVVNPPLLATEDTTVDGIKMFPGAVNYGGLDINGRDTVKPMVTGSQIPLGLELEEQRRRSINDSFLVTLFQIMVEGPQMTATEVLQRAQEKGVLLGPVYSRMQAEFFGPMIEREIEILSKMGVLPEIPQALLDQDGEYEIQYQSPLSKAAMAEEGIAILRTVEAIAPLAELDPKAARVLKAEDTIRELAEIYGLNPALLRSKDEMKALDAMSQEQEQQQQMLAAAPVAASAAKDLAQAQQAAMASPEPILGL